MSEWMGLAMQAPFKMGSWRENFRKQMKDAAAKAKAEGHEAAEAYEKYVQQNAEEL